MKIAEIIFPKTAGQAPKVKFFKNVKFKCTRCGTFCCHLGAPEFTVEDFDMLKKRFGNDLDRYIEKREIKSRQEDYLLPYSFKSVNGSECIFLRWNSKGKSGCRIYNIRPLLCRTFPFFFEQKGDRIEVNVVPCPGLKFNKNKKKKIGRATRKKSRKK
ncbi:MAG: YkgJ family cysteine cluster protein [Candidatus Micrarchaeia archaeon]